MSVQAGVGVKPEHPVITRIRQENGAMSRLDSRTRECVAWLIGAYAPVLQDNPDIRLNAAKSVVAQMLREREESPVRGASAANWDKARRRIDALFSRLYKPRGGQYVRHRYRRAS